MSMAQGFAQGFGMMNQYMQQQEHKEALARQEAENNRRYQDGINWRNKTYTDQQTRLTKQDEIADENRMMSKAQLGLTPYMTPDQVAETLKGRYEKSEQQAEEDRLLGREKDKLSMQATRANIAKTALDTRAAKLDLEDKGFQRSLTKLYMGAGSDDDVLALGDYGRGLAKRSNEFDQFAQQFSQLNDAVGKAETIDDRERSVGQLLGLMDSDIGRNVMNSAFMSSYAKRMKQDENIVSISSAGFVPLQGKLVPLMDIEYKDGTVKRGVPATTGKSGKSDDTVVALSPEQIRQQVAQAYTIQGQVKAKIDENPELGAKMGLISKDRYQMGYSGSVLDKYTGEVVENASGRDYASEQNSRNHQAMLKSIDGQIKTIEKELPNIFNPQDKAKKEAELLGLRQQALEIFNVLKQGNPSYPGGLPTAQAQQQQSVMGGVKLSPFLQTLHQKYNPQ